MRRFYDTILQRLKRLVSQPAEQATRWHKAARFAWDLGRYCARQLHEDRAGEMAAALTYRTIFSLVPFFVLSLIVFQAFGGFDAVGEQFKGQVYRYLGITAVTVQADDDEDADDTGVIPTPHLEEAQEAAARGELTPEQAALLERMREDRAAAGDPMELTETQRTAQNQAIAEASDAATAGELTADQALLLERAAARNVIDLSERQAAEVERTLAAARDDEQLLLRLDQVFDDLNQQVAQVSFTSIGVVGIVLLIWAALALAVQVEDSFNQIYHATTSRSWHLRVAIYWSLITLGPVLLALSLWLTGMVVSWFDGLLEMRAQLTGITYYLLALLGAVLSLLSQAAAFLASWVLLFLLYVLMPNTSVHIRPAVIGSMVAAAMWEIAKAIFGLYVNNAVGYTALYGTLALIPLFLFWVYVTWLIVLFGLELTYTLQTLKGRRLREIEGKHNKPEDMLIDPRWVIPIMAVIGGRFEQGKATSVSELREHTTLSLRALTRLTEQLMREGLLHCVQDPSTDGEGQLSLALPPNMIPIPRLLEVGQTLSTNVQHARRVAGREMLARLSEAERQAAAKLTLADMIEHPQEHEAPSAEPAGAPAR